jgi:glycosyltransferase involved in cell wall biosynthesis
LSYRPLVSIITPTYNHEQFIGRCIESVLSQTYDNWEQIIIDDGSTDITREVIKKYQDNRIRYIYQDNIGMWRLNETYNKALALAKGELIAILEGDDFWPTDKLDIQVPYFVNKNLVLTFGNVSKVNTNGDTIKTYSPNWNCFPRERPEIIKKLLLKNFIIACTAMCRKSTLYEIGCFNQHPSFPGVDYPTWLELSLKGDLLPVDHILGYWRKHDGQITNQITDHMLAKLQLEANRGEILVKFLERINSEQICSINLTTSDIHSIYEDKTAYANYFLGREALMQNNWALAHKYFISSLNKGGYIFRIGSLLGLVFALTRHGMEWIVKTFHKPRS